MDALLRMDPHSISFEEEQHSYAGPVLLTTQRTQRFQYMLDVQSQSTRGLEYSSPRGVRLWRASVSGTSPTRDVERARRNHETLPQLIENGDVELLVALLSAGHLQLCGVLPREGGRDDEDSHATCPRRTVPRCAFRSRLASRSRFQSDTEDRSCF